MCFGLYMEIKQLFSKDISRPINGVVKADQTENETVFVELDEYVITNELKEHIEKFFDFYMPSVYDAKQAAIAGKSGIWVSGFFGSGKSHFIKILSYLLQDIKTSQAGIEKTAFDFFSSKLAADPFLVGNIEKAIQKHNKVILFNIDSRANTDDQESAILKVFLKVFNEQLGYSGDHAHIAHLERDLDARGQYDPFKQAFNDITGELWEQQRDSFDFYRDDIADALATVTGQSNDSTRQWMDKLEHNFPLDIANFCKWVKEYLDADPERRILFFVDEVGQFIGSNTQMMLKLQTITENLGTICEGRAWVIVTSQEDIDVVLGKMQGSKSQDFSKIQARFERISLSSSNANEVIEKRLLDKTDTAKVALLDLYETKGDIIRSQLSFEKNNSVELANYSSSENFIASYPFVPYHYNLVQKIFSGISRAGASGQHMSKGERSLIDAFQIAANQFKDQEIGCLIPIYSFYSSIKKFLDTAVVRDITQASEKESIDNFTINVLQTLFMIRYVDDIKSTLDNLVILCIDEVDKDKRALRQKIEASLNVLERNLLIARQGDEYLFLTNEEKVIESEINNTELEPSDETTELSKIIFDEILRRNQTYRYPENKQDFPVARICNGIPFDRNIDTDIALKIISPIDVSYNDYNTAVCHNMSDDCILMRLDEHDKLFNELKAYIKTEKYLRKTAGSNPDQEQLRRNKAHENLTRRKRLVSEMETVLKNADFHVLGSNFDAKGSSVTVMLESAYRYIIENTFSQLKLIRPFEGNIITEIQQTLIADDTAQFGLDLRAEIANPQALTAIEQHIFISDENGYAITAADLIKHFSKRPYGWNTDEIILLLARLGLANKLIFQANQQDVALKHVYEHLNKSQKRANLRIRRVQQQSETKLRQAAQLYRELSFGNPPQTEKELFNVATKKLIDRQISLKGFKAKASTGYYPGAKIIEQGLCFIAALLEHTDSYHFIDDFINQADQLTDFEEDFDILENFYQSQFHVWQQLAQALTVKFNANHSALVNNNEARKALEQLQAIYDDQNPYSAIRLIQPLIETITKIDNDYITNSRAHTVTHLQQKITEVTTLLNKVNADAAVFNQALMPFQQAIKRIEIERSVNQIKHEQEEAKNWFKQAESLYNNCVRIIDLQKKKIKDSNDNSNSNSNSKKGNSHPISDPSSLSKTPNDSNESKSETTPQTNGQSSTDTDTESERTKELTSFDPIALYQQVRQGELYMEDLDDVNAFIDALKTELTTMINNNCKVRLDSY